VAGESPLTVEQCGPEHVLPLHWGFEDGGGSIATNSAAGNATADLVNFGAGAWDNDIPEALAGHSAFSLTFESSNSNYLDCGYLGISSTNTCNYGATVSMWIKPQAVDDARLLSLNRPTTTRPHPAGNVRLNTNALGQVFLEIGRDVTWLTLSSPDAIKTNQWQHLALTWRGNYVEAFIDGEYIGCALGSLDADRDANNDLVNFSIGRQYFNSGNFYQGKIDDLSIWDIAFCESQIQALAAGAHPLSVSPVVESIFPMSASNLLVQYRMDGDAEAKPELYNGTASSGASFSAEEDDTPFAYAGNMALSLDGVDDEVTMPVADILQPDTNAWSIALWFKTDAVDQKTSLISNRPGSSPYTQMSIYLGGIDSGSLGNGRRIHYLIMEEVIANSWEGVTQMDFADGQWHHLVLVRPGKGRVPSLYVDGERIAVQMLRTANSEQNINTVAPFKIGASTDSRLNYKGLIDEVAMWNSALSFEEVRWLSQNSLTEITPDGTILFVR
jgi:hypothetical protein